MTRIEIKRAYEPPAAGDGIRVLVDRLWPRGVAREAAHIDHWLKDVAPSAPLRKWFGHDPARWTEFRARYRAELKANAEAMAALRNLADKATKLTLVFAARDETHNNAVVLKELLD